MGIKFYCGISEKVFNHHPVAPGPYACISPMKGATLNTKLENRVYVPEGTYVLQDSGAFQDSVGSRLSFSEALERQIKHATKYNYDKCIDYRVSYDLLIDEVWNEGERFKQRWSVEDVEYAVEQTILAAKYLVYHRNNLNLCLSLQGVNAKQYMDCAQRIIPLMDFKRDSLGLGGWCIIGKMRKIMMPVFLETIKSLIPYAARCNVKRVHIFGVIYPKALGKLLWLCNKYEIKLSTDSASPSIYPIFGNWGYGEWRDKSYERPSTSIRGLERARHIELTRNWLTNFEKTQWYSAL